MAIDVTEVTVQEAKAVYDTLEPKSIRRLHEAIKAAGRYVSVDTLYRWQRQGWKLRDEIRSRSGLPRIMQLIDTSAIPTTFGDAKVRMRELISVIQEARDGKLPITLFQKALNPLAREVVGLTDPELLIEAHRIVMQAVAMGCRALMIDAEKFTTHPTECADALKAYAYCTSIITASLKGSNIPTEMYAPAIDQPAVAAAGRPAADDVVPAPQAVLDQLDETLRGWPSANAL